MENQVKVGDSIFWWGDYYDGLNEDGSLKTKYLSGVNKVTKTGIKLIDEEGFQLDNNKIFHLCFEHKNWELIKSEDKEVCVSCGEDTPYMIDTPIELRNYYIEGGGQLCEQCYIKIYGE